MGAEQWTIGEGGEQKIMGTKRGGNARGEGV